MTEPMAAANEPLKGDYLPSQNITRAHPPRLAHQFTKRTGASGIHTMSVNPVGSPQATAVQSLTANKTKVQVVAASTPSAALTTTVAIQVETMRAVPNPGVQQAKARPVATIAEKAVAQPVAVVQPIVSRPMSATHRIGETVPEVTANSFHPSSRSSLPTGRSAPPPADSHHGSVENAPSRSNHRRGRAPEAGYANSETASAMTETSPAPLGPLPLLTRLQLEPPCTFGRYHIQRLLGEGGMGAVFLAHDTQLLRQVAIKIPYRAEQDDPESLQRFFREAQTAALLRHPHICQVYDFGQEQGLHYLVMDYIEGQPLSHFIHPQRLIPQRQIALLIRRLALALHEAHRQGVIHRDLKPSNIIINLRNEPILMDFGLARRFSQQDDIRLTQKNTILGTPAYLAPERIRDAREDNPLTDIYSLGVIFYELLTGRLPFTGDTSFAVMVQIAHQEVVLPSRYRPDIDLELEMICLKSMTRQPERRYQSMAELVTALTDYLRWPQRPATATVPAPAPVSAEPVLATDSAETLLLTGQTDHAPSQDQFEVAKPPSHRALPNAETPTPTPTAETVPRDNNHLVNGAVGPRRRRRLPSVIQQLPPPPPEAVTTSLSLVWLIIVGACLLIVGVIGNVWLHHWADVRSRTTPAWQPIKRTKPKETWKADSFPLPNTAAPAIWTTADEVNSLDMAFTRIAGGEFEMGAQRSDPFATKEEIPPRHSVVRPFYLARHEVTQEQFHRIMGRQPSKWSNLSEGQKWPTGFPETQISQLPVENVTWLEAVQFCNRLSELEGIPPFYTIANETVTANGGLGYRLPEETEWEFACRAGSSTLWCFGNAAESLAEHGWFRDNANGFPHPVGTRTANAWGLHDMHGNVAEWVFNRFGTAGDLRVVRGGAYDRAAPDLRCAARQGLPTFSRQPNVGFRIARDVPLTP